MYAPHRWQDLCVQMLARSALRTCIGLNRLLFLTTLSLVVGALSLSFGIRLGRKDAHGDSVSMYNDLLDNLQLLSFLVILRVVYALIQVCPILC